MHYQYQIQYAGSITGMWSAVVLLFNFWGVSTVVIENWPILSGLMPLIASAIGVFALVWFGITAWNHFCYRLWLSRTRK